MRGLSADELLSVWERGYAASLPDRALALLQAACADRTLDQLGGMTVGQRDAALLKLREQAFGARLAGSAVCPACGERLELSLQVADVVSSFEEPGSIENPSAERAFSLSDGEFQVEFHLPTSGDLVAVARLEDARTAWRILLERCLVAVSRNGESQAISELPDETADAVIRRMAQLDPQGEINLALCCPSCEHRWRMLLDIVSFFWTEIDDWVRRIIREVHTLASAYGWREADILAMGPVRRQHYLDMVRG